MRKIARVFAGAAAGVGLLAMMATSASAYLACSGNVCWHVHKRYHYPRHAGITIHADTWRHGPSISIREHEGRGYWHGDTWNSW